MPTGLLKIVAAVFTVLVTKTLVEYASKKKVFVSFAIEDRKYRDLFVGQSVNSSTPFSFNDMSVKEPWNSAWKTKCRKRIKSCNGVIVLLSENALTASGVLWEVKCAIEEDMPILIIFTGRKIGKKRLPEVFRGLKTNPWKWDVINEFLSNL